MDILRRCVDSFQQYLADDQSLCAAYPTYMKDTRYYRDEMDNAAMEGHDPSTARLSSTYSYQDNNTGEENIADDAVSYHQLIFIYH